MTDSLTPVHISLPDSPPDPSDTTLFGRTPFPDWVQEFRDTQWEAITQVNDAYRNGTKVVFLQAPTGAGKSLIGESMRRLTPGRGPVTSATYACSSKALQDQFLTDFPYGRVIKGRANYLTQAGNLDQFGNPKRAGYSEVTCADCTYNPNAKACQWCREPTLCPYRVAKGRAVTADLAILNTSYLFTPGGSAAFQGRDVVIIDEADMLEQELLGHIEVHITAKRMERMQLMPPTRKTVESAWLTWAKDEAVPGVTRYLNSLPNVEWEYIPHHPDPVPFPSTDATRDDIRELNYVTRLLDKLRILEAELPEGGWIYDGYDRGDCLFRPIYVRTWGERLLWPLGRRFLLMSATILSADLMADELGYYGDYEFVDMPSTFPVENRPIHVCPVADMTFKSKDTEWPKMATGIQGVLNRHPDERILVHTVSYALANYLMQLVDKDRPIITYTSSADKERALKEYKKHPNSVMFAPSMDRGIDLPDDLCRVQVVAKVPWPNTSDKRTSARMHTKGGRSWYAMQTIRTLIQMCGRGVRSAEDSCVTYILDKQFATNLAKNNDYLFPQWWSDALNYRFPPRRLGVDT